MYFLHIVHCLFTVALVNVASTRLYVTSKAHPKVPKTKLKDVIDLSIDIAIDHGAESTPFYDKMNKIIIQNAQNTKKTHYDNKEKYEYVPEIKEDAREEFQNLNSDGDKSISKEADGVVENIFKQSIQNIFKPNLREGGKGQLLSKQIHKNKKITHKKNTLKNAEEIKNKLPSGETPISRLNIKHHLKTKTFKKIPRTKKNLNFQIVNKNENQETMNQVGLTSGIKRNHKENIKFMKIKKTTTDTWADEETSNKKYLKKKFNPKIKKILDNVQMTKKLGYRHYSTNSVLSKFTRVETTKQNKETTAVTESRTIIKLSEKDVPVLSDIHKMDKDNVKELIKEVSKSKLIHLITDIITAKAMKMELKKHVQRNNLTPTETTSVERIQILL